MAYTLEGKKVSSAVTVRVYIQDDAVKFWAKHAKMGLREARREMTRKLIGNGDDNGLDLYFVHGYPQIDFENMGYSEDVPDFVRYDDGTDYGVGWYSIEVK